jgi:LmbE family N-acetylglucosaminyl deacetylase
MQNVVLSVLAHPDDCEFLCAGTMIRLVREQGWEAHIASMTPGDCGSAEHSADEISRIRRAEGAQAAELLGATYHCLEERDLRIVYGERPLEKVAALIRRVQPRLVITHSPADYMLDHEMTSTIARAACFAAPCPNFTCTGDNTPSTDHIPHLYYCDAAEGKDLFGQSPEPTVLVDIVSAMPLKLEMLAAHASQRNWLLRQHGMDQYLETMKHWSALRGAALGVAYAEGFRQHLGHSYPQEDLLGRIFGK